MEKLQSREGTPPTPAEDENTQKPEAILEGPITRERDIRNKLKYLGIPFSEEFLTGSRHDELQKEYGIVQWHERQRMNMKLRLSNKVLDEINFDVLLHIYRGIKNKYTFHRKIRSHIMLAELKGINRGEPATPEELETTRLELNYLELDIPAEQLTCKDRRTITRLALERRANRINKYGNPYKNGLKSNHTTPIPGPRFIPSVSSNLIAHTMFKPSAGTVIQPMNPWEKVSEQPERRIVVTEPEKDEPIAEDNGVPSLPLSLGSSRQYPVHVVKHNRKARQKKDQKMRRIARSSSNPKETTPEPPAEAGSLSQLCPHPHKKNYVTTELAEEFMRESHPDDPNIEVYRCKCGGIHIGHNYARKRTKENRKKHQQEKEQANSMTGNHSTTKASPTPHDIFKAAQRKKGQAKEDA